MTLTRLQAKDITVAQTDEQFTLDVKRCYLPLVLTTHCPKCSAVMKTDLSDHYLSYPSVGSPEQVVFHCRACEELDDYTEYESHIVVSITAVMTDKRPFFKNEE